MPTLLEKVKGRLKVVEVPMPEWDCSVYLRELTSAESFELAPLLSAATENPTDAKAGTDLVRTMLLHCLVNEKREQEFTNLEQVDEFLRLASAESIQRLATEAGKIRRENLEAGKEPAES